jgi:hypothetical protein
MKLDGKTLVIVGVVVGALGAMGCSKPANDEPAAKPEAKPVAAQPAQQQQQPADTGAVAPEENAASAPVEDPSKPGFEKDSFRGRYYAPYGPPAARYETRGYAPSRRHFWAPGYWRWSGRQYMWYGGRWEYDRPGYVYAGPTWHRHHASRYEYRPGRWTRRY